MRHVAELGELLRTYRRDADHTRGGVMARYERATVSLLRMGYINIKMISFHPGIDDDLC